MYNYEGGVPGTELDAHVSHMVAALGIPRRHINYSFLESYTPLVQ